MKRVTLRLKSDAGNDYLYDDVTGNIFPWGDLDDVLLNKELGYNLTDRELNIYHNGSQDSIEPKSKFIRRWRDQYGAFVRDDSCTIPEPTAGQVEQAVWHNAMVLLLIISDTCNMRCKYCATSSGEYQYNKPQTGRMMTYETAIRAIDWYIRGIETQRKRNPLKTFGLSFYGGEPLLNIHVIDKVMHYCHERYPDTFTAALTTNGLLLTDENVNILNKWNISVAISLDGPEAEHDRLRIDHDGNGTHKRIVANFNRIKQNYPEFWNKMRLLPIYDTKSRVDVIAKYFEESGDSLPIVSNVNPVVSYNSRYYDQFTESDYALSGKLISKLMDTYKERKKANDNVDIYLSAITGHLISNKTLRRRLCDNKGAFLPYTGCCMPGTRMAISVDGEINMCERVNGTNPIGHIDTGLDYKCIANLINEYQTKILYKCASCPITKICNLCFSQVETDGGIAEPANHCRREMAVAWKTLSDFVSIMEVNKHAADDMEYVIEELHKQIVYNA